MSQNNCRDLPGPKHLEVSMSSEKEVTSTVLIFILIEDIPFCFNSKSETVYFKLPSKHNSVRLSVFYCGSMFPSY